MAMHYRLGWPLGRLLAKAGVPTLIRINVIRDDEAEVYVGTSNDVRGLVVEAATFEELMAETHDTIASLLECDDGILRDELVTSIRVNDHFAHA